MDKFFENMDNRFKSIEQELKYNFDSKFWEQAENELNNAELDNAFTHAAEQATLNSNIDFNDIDDAFLDEAFVEAAKNTHFEYQATYWTDYTRVENTLYYNDAFVTAAALTHVVYDPNYWQDANLALQDEGLHHEYKPDYWKEAEKMLMHDSRKGFFFKWGVAATVLLLLSFLTFNINQPTVKDLQLSDNHKTNSDIEKVDKTKHPLEKKSTQSSHNNDVDNHLISEQNTSLADVRKSSNNQLSNPNSQANNSVTKHEVNEDNKGDKLSETKVKINKPSTIDDINHLTPFNKQNKNTNDLVDDHSINKNSPSLNTKTINYENNEAEKREDIAQIHFNNGSLIHVSNNYNPKGIHSNRIDISSIDLAPTHLLSAELSKGIGNNFNNNNYSFRNALYVSYRFIPFSPKTRNFSYGIDVGLYHQNLNNYEYESQYAVYHVEGNVDHYWYKMVYKDLVYLSTKANVYYTLAPKHTFKLGFGVDKLITTRIDMQYKINSDLTQKNSSEQWGLNKGFNNLDFSINLGYEFKVNSNFAFTVNAKHGILDKTNNEYLNRKSSDKDKSILLGIKYTFLRK